MAGLVGVFLHHRRLPVELLLVGALVSVLSVPSRSGLVDGVVVELAVEFQVEGGIFLGVHLGLAAVEDEGDGDGGEDEASAAKPLALAGGRWQFSLRWRGWLTGRHQ